MMWILVDTLSGSSSELIMLSWVRYVLICLTSVNQTRFTMKVWKFWCTVKEKQHIEMSAGIALEQKSVTIATESRKSQKKRTKVGHWSLIILILSPMNLNTMTTRFISPTVTHTLTLTYRMTWARLCKTQWNLSSLRGEHYARLWLEISSIYSRLQVSKTKRTWQNERVWL